MLILRFTKSEKKKKTISMKGDKTDNDFMNWSLYKNWCERLARRKNSFNFFLIEFNISMHFYLESKCSNSYIFSGREI